MDDQSAQPIQAEGMQPPFIGTITGDERDSPLQADLIDSSDDFRKSAQIFLDIHRQEVERRDAETSKLKAELTRVREILRAVQEKLKPIESKDSHASLSMPTRGIKAVGSGLPHGHEGAAQDPKMQLAPPDKFFASLTEDELSDAYQTIHDIWEFCFHAVKHAMEQNLSDDVLAEWNVMYWLDFEERIPNITSIPFEPSNSPTAKRTRTMLVMALLAKSLEEYILSPTYVFEDDDELRLLLANMHNTEKKTYLRRLLLSISDDGDTKEAVKEVRVQAAVQETVQPLQNLVSPEALSQLKSDLHQVFNKAATAWEPLQRCRSHYEVSTKVTRTGWDWKSVHFVEDGSGTGTGTGINLVTVDSSAFETDEVVTVLFPRVCAIDRSNKPSFTPVFPGIVVQKSQMYMPMSTVPGPPAEDVVVPDMESEAQPAQVAGTNATTTTSSDGSQGKANITETPDNSDMNATTNDTADNTDKEVTPSEPPAISTDKSDGHQTTHTDEERKEGEGKHPAEENAEADDSEGESDGDGDGDDEDEDDDQDEDEDGDADADGESGTETGDGTESGSEGEDDGEDQPHQTQIAQEKGQENKTDEDQAVKIKDEHEPEQGNGWITGSSDLLPNEHQPQTSNIKRQSASQLLS